MGTGKEGPWAYTSPGSSTHAQGLGPSFFLGSLLRVSVP